MKRAVARHLGDPGAETHLDVAKLLRERANVVRHPPGDLVEPRRISWRHPFEQRVHRKLRERLERCAPAGGKERIDELGAEGLRVALLRQVPSKGHREVSLGSHLGLLGDEAP
jgi:hypothetical protein